MIIKYKKDSVVVQEHSIEIKDTKNVFLKGKNIYDGLNTYFGIWTNEKFIIILSIISNRCINYEYSLNKNIYTKSDIIQYLQYNNNVVEISKKEFKEQLDNLKNIIKF